MSRLPPLRTGGRWPASSVGARARMAGSVVARMPVGVRARMPRSLLAATLLLSACSGGEESPPENDATAAPPTVPAEELATDGLYLRGPESARFTECASGRSWRVSETEEAHALAGAYLAVGGGAGEPVRVRVVGRGWTGEGADSLVVEEFSDPEAAGCPGAEAALALEGVPWRLLSARGVPTPEGVDATLRLDPSTGRAEGSTGCNGFTGGYDLAGGRLRFDALGLTRLACPAGAERLEPELLEALRTTGSFRVVADTLELLAEEGVVARWVAVQGG